MVETLRRSPAGAPSRGSCIPARASPAGERERGNAEEDPRRRRLGAHPPDVQALPLPLQELQAGERDERARGPRQARPGRGHRPHPPRHQHAGDERPRVPAARAEGSRVQGHPGHHHLDRGQGRGHDPGPQDGRPRLRQEALPGLGAARPHREDHRRREPRRARPAAADGVRGLRRARRHLPRGRARAPRRSSTPLLCASSARATTPRPSPPSSGRCTPSRATAG